MPRTRYTLAQLRTRLSERVGNQVTFWKEPEMRDALNEAIAFWQATTGEWTTRVSIEAKSDSPNFYPVPKQIVSVTRVGIFDETETLNPLGGSIVPPNEPVFRGSPGSDAYSTSPGVPIAWAFVPTGGVPPYVVTWDWDDGTANTVGGLHATHAFDESVEGTDVQVTATVLDAAGDTFETEFEVEILIPMIELLFDGGTINDPQDVTLSDGGDGYYYTDWVTLRAEVQYDGSSSTTGSWANRYPITVEWDFLPAGLPEDGGSSQMDQIQFADSTQTLQETITVPTALKKSHTILNAWHFNDGAVSPGFPYQDPDAIGGGNGPSTMLQDPDNMEYDTNGDGFGEQGYVRWRFPGGWVDNHPKVANKFIIGNFTVKVTDGTGYTTTYVYKLQWEEAPV